MSIINNGIRAWWLEKPISHNMPTDIAFEDFKPTVMNAPNREWIRVVSLDDLHKTTNINITRYVEVCDELHKLRSQLKEADAVIKTALYIRNEDEAEIVEESAKCYQSRYMSKSGENEN